MTIQERARIILNLEPYAHRNKPEWIGRLRLFTPTERQYILRMLVREPFSDFLIPDELEWTRPAIEGAYAYQRYIGIEQPFCYVTVRHGLVESVSDDIWHVDGFSTNITHIPEQNYLWSTNPPTEYVVQPVHFPSDFNPARHNIHKFLQHVIAEKNSEIRRFQPENLYALDPYVIHRRPPMKKKNRVRTLLRVSFTPIEINDINNTQNPLLPRDYKMDRVREFRDKLVDYHAERAA